MIKLKYISGAKSIVKELYSKGRIAFGASTFMKKMRVWKQTGGDSTVMPCEVGQLTFKIGALCFVQNDDIGKLLNEMVRCIESFVQRDDSATKDLETIIEQHTRKKLSKQSCRDYNECSINIGPQVIEAPMNNLQKNQT